MNHIKIFHGAKARVAALKASESMERVIVEGSFFDETKPGWQIVQNCTKETKVIIVDRPNHCTESLWNLINDDWICVRGGNISPQIFIIPTPSFLFQLQCRTSNSPLFIDEYKPDDPESIESLKLINQD